MTSLVSDEYQTNEDLELCSDLDTREYQEEHRLRQPGLGSDPEGIVDVNLSFYEMHLSIISPSIPLF